MLEKNALDWREGMFGFCGFTKTIRGGGYMYVCKFQYRQARLVYMCNICILVIEMRLTLAQFLLRLLIWQKFYRHRYL